MQFHRGEPGRDAGCGPAVLLMMGSHEMMYTGQIAAIRRKLGKPIVI
jgi:hypothetical protein